MQPSRLLATAAFSLFRNDVRNSLHQDAGAHVMYLEVLLDAYELYSFRLQRLLLAKQAKYPHRSRQVEKLPFKDTNVFAQVGK